MSSSLEEIKSQLSEIQQLLLVNPDDEGLKQLEKDLKELKQLTESTTSDSNNAVESTEQNGTKEHDTAAETMVEPANESNMNEAKQPEDPAKGIDSEESKPKKKSKKKKLTNFEIPPHLLPHEKDSSAETSRKKRAVKALKNKWREQKKAEESKVKQQSWQNFQQKKKLKNTKSMFSSSASGKVGVVQASDTQSVKKTTTTSNSRKRLWQEG